MAQNAEARRAGDKDLILANVALLYYGEGLNQSEIAKRMDVSRATVVNMLRDCRERGIVEIRVSGEMLAGSSISRDLCARFGLTDAYIARSRAGATDRDEALAQVARVAAMALLDVVSPGDTVGVAWGETVKALADALPHQPVPNVTVCQMIGSMVSDRVAASEDCTIGIAARLDAACFTLHAPAALSSADLAAQLRAEPMITAQLARLRDLDLAVFSVGNMATETHMVAAGIASEVELGAAAKAGAQGILCCRYLGQDGQAITMPSDGRIIGIEVDDLRRARKRLLVAAGSDRRNATLAALAGGLVTHLCVDDTLAQALIEA